MNRKTWPLLVCVLLLAGLALAQAVPGVDTTEPAHGLIPIKVAALIEAIILVVMMLVRGFSDPEWKTTFFNWTNITAVIGAVNGVVVFLNPNGMSVGLQMGIARVIMFVVPFLFVRRMTLGARLGTLFGNQPEPTPPPKLDLK